MGHRIAGTAKVQGKLSHILINVMMSDRIYTRRKSVPGRNDVKKSFFMHVCFKVSMEKNIRQELIL